MKTSLRIALALFLPLMTLPADAEPPTPSPTRQTGQIVKINGLTPQQKLTADLAKNQIHFLGVKGSATPVPGIENYAEKYANQVPLEIIEGTSDAPQSEEARGFNNRAFTFAQRYNTLLKAKLELK